MNIFFDVECYVNYFYIRFEAKKSIYQVRLFNDAQELGDRETVRRFIQKNTYVTFNGTNYDLPMLTAWLAGYSNADLKKLSDYIIKSSKPWWMISNAYPKLRIPRMDHIDLMGVTPLQASLKTYGCRIHVPSLVDLPIHPDTTISREQVPILERYCGNDCAITADILNASLGDLKLRRDMGKQYGQDFRSKSGPQIAEAVLRQQLVQAGVAVEKRETRVKPFQYQAPDFIQFGTPDLRALLRRVKKATFRVDKNGYARLPDELNVAIPFAGAKYKLGIGGLHSQEQRQAVLADGRHLGEWDVGSMYPSIILGLELYPDHIGPEFCTVYRDIYTERMAAKRAGNKMVSESLKLVLNSSFGKFGSRYSFLYSPELLIQITLTGQLSLLMLIEMFHAADIRTVSANTDGVVVHHSDQVAAQAVVDMWQQRTGYELEWTPYSAIYSESVNNYIALKEGGGAKLKGTYAPGSIAKGYQNEIVVEALVAFLEHGTPLQETIDSCTDVCKFLTMRGIRGGGVWRDQDVGRVARWYVSTDGDPIRYKTNGNKVAGSDSARPMMELGEIPKDLDRAWYVERARALLPKLGVK